MKLLCECGHALPQHFGPTGPCHKHLEIEKAEDWPAVDGSALERRLHPKCPCTRFVPMAERRADLV